MFVCLWFCSQHYPKRVPWHVRVGQARCEALKVELQEPEQGEFPVLSSRTRLFEVHEGKSITDRSGDTQQKKNLKRMSHVYSKRSLPSYLPRMSLSHLIRNRARSTGTAQLWYLTFRVLAGKALSMHSSASLPQRQNPRAPTVGSCLRLRKTVCSSKMLLLRRSKWLPRSLSTSHTDRRLELFPFECIRLMTSSHSSIFLLSEFTLTSTILNTMNTSSGSGSPFCSYQNFCRFRPYCSIFFVCKPSIVSSFLLNASPSLKQKRRMKPPQSK